MTSYTDLLDEQYRCLEAFANAQSRLLNASSFTAKTTSRHRPDDEAEEEGNEVDQAVKHLMSCRQKVQHNLKRFMDDEQFCRKHNAHLDLSRRIIRTMAKNPSWDRVGIPSHLNAVLETNTVALATLRASICLIKDLEGVSNF